jgi:hypothetical protein
MMALTRDQRRALEAARKEAIRGYQAEKRRRRHIEAFERARTRAENKFKRGMADRLLAAAGLDRGGVEEQVERDHTAVTRFIRARAAEARRNGRGVLGRQRKYAQEYLGRVERLLPLDPLPSPRTEVLDKADDITVVDGTKSSTSIAKGKNIGRVLLFHDDSASIFEYSSGSWRFAQINWSFLWSPPIEGDLTVAAFLMVNGWRQVWCLSSCLTSGTAGATISTQLSITQNRFGGPWFTDTSAPVQLFDPRVSKSADESTGQIDVGGLDLPWVLTTDRPFPIDGLSPVVISVQLLLRVDCRRAQSTIDLFEKDFQANVPGLIVNVE